MAVRVLVACEYSGRVRDAFARRGHHAVSVDMLNSETDGWHYRGDVLKFLEKYPKWDLMIAFPPCTHLATVNASHWKIKQANGLQDEAVHFFLDLFDQTEIPRIAIENPVGALSSRYRKPDQYVQPWWFGDPWTKRTGLWLKGLPPLWPDRPVRTQGHWVDGGTYSNDLSLKYNPSGATNNEGAYVYRGYKSKLERAKERARTFRGLARAMAQQWG